MSKLTIDKEKIKACLKKYPDFKEVALELWPELKEKTKDITEDITWSVMQFGDYSGGTINYWLIGRLGMIELLVFDKNGLSFNHEDYEKEFEIRTHQRGFQILRRDK